jgi:UDP-N-acetylmuramoyl-L-alanyl-D-glutamate--2,6-diaminopimelate ligase
MRFIKKIIPQSLKNLYHLLQAILANVCYGFPSHKIKVIGITGTDGKTTTAQMVAKILQTAGKRVALASTINFIIDGQEEKNLSHYTTESSFAIQKFIRKAVEASCEYLVLEVSSHSLDQHRVWGIRFQTAVITNVTREHLDYHKTMEKYRQAKGLLFKSLKSNFKFSILNFKSQPKADPPREEIFNDKILNKNKKISVVNLDMESPEEFLNFDADEKYGYGLAISNQPASSADRSSVISKNPKLKIIKAENIELGINGSSYKIQDTKYSIQLPGLFNVENALAATCVALGEGIDLEVASEALSKIKGVAGRMEALENDLGVNILVDFALTPNALEKLYSLLFSVKKEGAKIIAIFGSCGDRDRGKRPLMGEIVSKYADVVILTNDEPYHEEPERIIEEIFVGIKNKTEGENLWRIIDRRQAIAKALSLAKPGDIICITGMGNFETMVVGDEKIPWNDRQVIEEELGKIQ